jgi:hypothetical protein
MNGNSYPALAQFLGGYFHQDFLLDYGNPDGAIAAFVTGEPPESIHAACNELEQVIPLIEWMDDPEKFLWRVLGCYYLPKADGLTVADWLKHVHKKLCG